jgi:hypothetical protein
MRAATLRIMKFVAYLALLLCVPALASKKAVGAAYEDAVLTSVDSVPDGTCTITNGTGNCESSSIRVYQVTIGTATFSLEHRGWHASPLYRMVPGTHFQARIDMPHVYMLDNGKEVRFLIVKGGPQ